MKKLFTVSVIILFGLICFEGGWFYGLSQNHVVKPIQSVFNSRIDVYNVYMLKNCLQELKTVKGGEL